MEKILVLSNDEVIEATGQTLESIVSTQKQWITEKEIQAQAQAQATIEREAAEAKLAALGLTSDDLKALGL